ncbi:MAG: YraN family protein [Verrucomicrobiota bacterium]
MGASKSILPSHQHGRTGEKAAVKFLRSRGLKVLMRNYHSRRGEIDIIAREKDILVFVEVKARQEKFADKQRPGEAVTAVKKRRLIATGEAYLRELKKEVPFRYDVVEVYLAGDDVLECRHYRQVF